MCIISNNVILITSSIKININCLKLSQRKLHKNGKPRTDAPFKNFVVTINSK